MKRITFLLIPFCIPIYLMISGYGGSLNPDHSSGAPAGYTGSPSDGHNCTSCHGGSASTIPGQVTSDIPSAGYTAGTTYNITVTVTGSNKKGFEVSPQGTSGTYLGTLIAGSTSHITGTKYITHNSGITGNAVWNFQWTAPVAGTGTVTFYAACVASEPVTKLSTLVVNENTVLPLSVAASATPQSICSGQTSQLGVATTGGSGTYTYEWTSVPPGFTSTNQNPLVSPTINTTYNIVVSDGTNTANASTSVTVNQTATVYAGIDTTYCANIVSFQNSGTSSNYASVLWTTSGDGTFMMATAPTSTYTPGTGDKSSGSVTLTLTATPLAPCTGTVTDSRHITLDPCNGIPLYNGSQSSVSAYPNPSQGSFTLFIQGLEDQPAMITIYDIRGNQLLQERTSGTLNFSKTFDLTGYPKGLYTIRVQTFRNVVVGKVVLQ